MISQFYNDRQIEQIRIIFIVALLAICELPPHQLLFLIHFEHALILVSVKKSSTVIKLQAILLIGHVST